MPLTKTGEEVMSNMMSQYGAKKGKQVFYASINAKKKGSSKWHKIKKAHKKAEGAVNAALAMARARKKK